LNLPPPGVYDQPSTIGKGPAASISGRPAPPKPSEVPGPGSYQAKVDVLKDKTLSYKMP